MLACFDARPDPPRRMCVLQINVRLDSDQIHGRTPAPRDMGVPPMVENTESELSLISA